MAFVLTSTGHVIEIAEDRKTAVDLVTAGGDRANFTVKAKPMTFYLPVVAIADNKSQVDFVQVGVGA